MNSAVSTAASLKNKSDPITGVINSFVTVEMEGQVELIALFAQYYMQKAVLYNSIHTENLHSVQFILHNSAEMAIYAERHVNKQVNRSLVEKVLTAV